MKRTASREDYQRKKSAKLESRERNACICADYDVLLKDLQDSKRQVTIRDQSIDQPAIDEVRSTVEWLVELLQDSDTLQTKDGKAYTSKLKMCVIQLLDGNVSACRVGETIKTVLKLAKKKASDIPSNATVLNYNVERHIWPKGNLSRDENISLLTDETSLARNTWDTMLQPLMAT